MTLAKGITVSTGIASLIGTIFVVHSYFAKAEELQQFKAYSEYTFDEMKAERLEDKIQIIEVKPVAERKAYEREKLLKLKAQHERIIRRIERNESGQ